MSAPNFAMITEAEFRRLPKEEQINLLHQAGEMFPLLHLDASSGFTQWYDIRAAQVIFWDARVEPAPQFDVEYSSIDWDKLSYLRAPGTYSDMPMHQAATPRNSRVTTAPGRTFAEECNAWLATLPPVPFFGDDEA